MFSAKDISGKQMGLNRVYHNTIFKIYFCSFEAGSWQSIQLLKQPPLACTLPGNWWYAKVASLPLAVQYLFCEAGHIALPILHLFCEEGKLLPILCLCYVSVNRGKNILTIQNPNV